MTRERAKGYKLLETRQNGAGYFRSGGAGVSAVSRIEKGAVKKLESIKRKKWRAFRNQILERDGFMCFYCGTVVKVYCEQTEVGNQVAHIDHLQPQSKGGTDDISNLVTSCRSCNCSKGKKSLQEYRDFVGFQTSEYIRSQVYLQSILDECEHLPFRKQLKAMLEWLRSYRGPIVFPGEVRRDTQERMK